ncbi:unnamed protein product [Urochloa humidicola]
MELPNGRGDAPTVNDGVNAEETETATVRRKKAQVQLVREAIHGLLEEKRKDNGHGHGDEEKDLLPGISRKKNASCPHCSPRYMRPVTHISLWIVSVYRVLC